MPRDWKSGKEIITRCCSCQKIPNEAGEWQDLAESPGEMQEALFSHTVCPACLALLYPELVSPGALTGRGKNRPLCRDS